MILIFKFYIKKITFGGKVVYIMMVMLHRLDEYLLVEKVKSGDKIAFATLYQNYVHRLCLISFRLTGDKSVAEDVVQDFFVNFWMKKAELNFTTSFYAYASRSVYNASLNKNRITKRIADLDDARFVSDSEITIEDEDLAECRERLNQAIECLPPQRRKIFEIICINGLSYAEAAESMGLSINTIKVNMSKAYRTIKEKINLDVSFLFVLALCF